MEFKLKKKPSPAGEGYFTARPYVKRGVSLKWARPKTQFYFSKANARPLTKFALGGK